MEVRRKIHIFHPGVTDLRTIEKVVRPSVKEDLLMPVSGSSLFEVDKCTWFRKTRGHDCGRICNLEQIQRLAACTPCTLPLGYNCLYSLLLPYLRWALTGAVYIRQVYTSIRTQYVTTSNNHTKSFHLQFILMAEALLGTAGTILHEYIQPTYAIGKPVYRWYEAGTLSASLAKGEEFLGEGLELLHENRKYIDKELVRKLLTIYDECVVLSLFHPTIAQSGIG